MKITKDKLREQAKNKYWELSNEEKRTKREYGRNTYQNISEEDEQRLNEYQKTIVKQNNQHKNLSFFSLQRIKIENKPWFLINSVLIKIHFIKIKDQLVLIY